ncbi:MAG: T9SS type A sorting domain-containing protein [Saprospiraceae bacterium]|nr:T9SS type A sorting domain-containing protein [Saprospiraceae bacterium]
MNELSLLNYARLRKSLMMLFLSVVTVVSYGGIVFDGSPGAAAPPNTLGGMAVFPFPSDPRTLLLDETTVNASESCPLAIQFSPAMSHRRVPLGGWNNWSHGYTGDVYFSNGLTSVTITLPPNTRAFYLYSEVNLFATATIVVNANDGTTSGPVPVTTPNGARYFGFYTTSPNCLLTTVTVTVPAGNVGFAIGEFGINVDVNNGAIACNNNIQISLDQDCRATIYPDMILEGGGNVSCPGDYSVVARDWNTNQIIDLDLFRHYPQIGAAQIGKKLKITITDPFTGNSCWGTAYVEDKLGPILTCPRSLEIPCTQSVAPSSTGTPGVVEACGSYTLTYKDVVSLGGCNFGYDKIITRTWTAEDAYGNKSYCIQIITVLLGDLDDITPPFDYTGLPLPNNLPALSCDAKIDRNFNVASHLRPSPECVDDYLLDQAYFIGTGIRRPRTLGWNCIETGVYAGHPNPTGIYYAANAPCWGDNQIVMWHGTGQPSASGCNNIAITFRDLRIDIAKPGCDAGPVGCYKLLRTWTMLDWCTGSVREHNQIIKVVDAEGPEILYPDNLVVSTDPWRCEGRWDVSPAWVTDNCSNDVHYTIRVDNGTVLGNESTGYIVVNLPLGIQNAYIVAEDCCGNVTEKLIVLDVQDNTPPIPVCDQKTVVSISGNLSPGENLAKIFAETFDDGSFDNCATHLSYKVIRMDELDGTNNGSNKESTVCNRANGDDNLSVVGSQTYFDDLVYFCCNDVNTTVMVVFRVFDVDPGAGPINPSRMNSGGDLFGHYSDCMVEVDVQDKSIPTVVAPPDIVISCDFWFDINTLTDPNNSTFGKVVTDIAWRKKVTTTDVVCEYYCVANPITGYPGYVGGIPAHLAPASNKACDYFNSLFNAAHPDNKYELVWGFDGYVLSSCSVSPTITVQDLRECGQGRILRTITARGPGGVVVSATQTIWTVNCDPFYIDRNNHCSTTDDIIWPDCEGRGTTVNGCGANTHPDNIGRPRLTNRASTHCDLLAIQNFDEVFTIEPDACYKILRRWVVIDWCQYDPNIDRENGRWEFTQVIKVRDIVAPTVTCHVGACEPASINTTLGVCVGHIRLEATATDSCSPEDWLSFEYKIDAFNNGTIDYTVGTLTKRQFAQGDRPAVRNNPFADNPNNPFDASGIYPIGVHRITWYVEDGCGNLGTCSTLFEIKDCKAPTPYCLTGIITVPMPSSGCVDIWAKDLDHGSFDNCTPKNRLKFYFNGDSSKTYLRVCCDDFVAAGVNDELRVEVEVWVEDEEGNRDYCRTVVIVQDNQDLCPNDATAQKGKINGLLKTEEGDNAADVVVDIFRSGQLINSKTTLQDGQYTFRELNYPASYMLKGNRDGDYVNGVTTADIVRIQRHILAAEPLTSPYKILAADVNKTNSVTAADISEIRKLILGNTEKFAKSNSWLIVPEGIEFTNPSQPWNYTTEKTMTLNGPQDVINFVAIKMGDVNGSAQANVNGKVQSRTNQSIQLIVNETALEAGQTQRVEVRSSNFNQIAGYQFTLNFDHSLMSFEGFESGAIQLNDQNFNVRMTEKGLLTTSWNANSAINVSADEILFTLIFKANRAGNLGGSMEITSDLTVAEAYNSSLDIMDVNLMVRNNQGQNVAGVFELFQNTPNPFDAVTEVSFRLPSAAPAVLTVYDVTGKVHRVYQVKGQKGMNTVRIEKSELNGTGMFYYQLDSDNQTATRRMVIVE